VFFVHVRIDTFCSIVAVFSLRQPSHRRQAGRACACMHAAEEHVERVPPHCNRTSYCTTGVLMTPISRKPRSSPSTTTPFVLYDKPNHVLKSSPRPSPTEVRVSTGGVMCFRGFRRFCCTPTLVARCLTCCAGTYRTSDPTAQCL
jgi:hypothetical protein